MDKTRFWAERLYVNSKISSHIYYAEKDIPEVIGIGENEEDPFLTDPYLEENLRRCMKKKGRLSLRRRRLGGLHGIF